MDRPEPFSLDNLFLAKHDTEKSKLLMKADIKKAEEAIDDYRLIPGCLNLQKFYIKLLSFLDSIHRVKDGAAELVGLDGYKRELLYDLPNMNNDELESIVDLANWAQSRASDVVRDGKEKLKEADKAIKLDTIGADPPYTREGYLMVFSGEEKALRIHPYERSNYFPGYNKEYETRISNPVKEVDLSGVAPPLKIIRANVIQEHDWLTDPATYVAWSSGEHFPYKHTLLPVAVKALSERLKNRTN